ncbi:MAG: serine protease [Limnohabitans sp.]|nr:serine protease [Limnohabitans sp.]
MKRWFFIRCAILLGCASALYAQTATSPEQTRQLLERAQNAVVLVSSRAIEDAPSARTLGRERQGTGVVIGSDGLILTIGYLILETEQIEIRTHQQKTYPAHVVAYDQATGFGLIKSLVPLSGIVPVQMGQSKDQKIDEMLVVATAGETTLLGPTKLKDIRPFTGYWEYHLDRAIYTNPPVADHSGAGLFNLKGELVGVGSLFMQDIMPEHNPESLAGNMYVPTDLLAPILKEMLQNGMGPQSRRPWLGINAVERQGRIQIVRVTPESPAQKAGLRAGQWVLALEGRPIENLATFYKQVWALPLNSSIFRVTIFDGREIRQIPLPVVDRSATIKKPTGI